MATAPATEAQEPPAAADNGAGAIQRQVQPSTAGDTNHMSAEASEDTLSSGVGTDRASAMIGIGAETPFARAQQTPSDPTLELLTLRIARFAGLYSSSVSNAV